MPLEIFFPIKIFLIADGTLKIKTAAFLLLFLAGETRIEHATYGFGDRCSTN